MNLEELQNNLFEDFQGIVKRARSHVATTANKTITIMYWKIGERINNELLDGGRAAYGKQIVSHLATLLQEQFGMRGFKKETSTE